MTTLRLTWISPETNLEYKQDFYAGDELSAIRSFLNVWTGILELLDSTSEKPIQVVGVRINGESDQEYKWYNAQGIAHHKRNPEDPNTPKAKYFTRGEQ